MSPPDGFVSYLQDAIRHFSTHGYTSQDELDVWLARLRQAAERELLSDAELRDLLKRSLGAVYDRLVDRRGVVKNVPGVARWTIEMVKPQLRAELDRRILASADLIKLNRRAAIEKTLQRFSGWSTSIPAGGDTVIDKREARSDIGKSIKQVRFEARRVAIDQGHKLAANITDIVATSNGAIAAIWHSHWRQPGYDYRVDHKERDQKVYAIRGNWAIEKGLMKRGEAGYLDEITQPAQEPFCRCYAQYISTLRALPDEMLTQKGRDALKDMRAA